MKNKVLTQGAEDLLSASGKDLDESQSRAIGTCRLKTLRTRRAKVLTCALALALTLGCYFAVLYPAERALVDRSMQDISGASPEVRALLDVSKPPEQWEMELYGRYSMGRITSDDLGDELCSHWGLSVRIQDIYAWIGRINVYTNTLDFFGLQLYLPVPTWFKISWHPFGEAGVLLAASLSLTWHKFRNGTQLDDRLIGVLLFLFFFTLYVATVLTHTNLDGDQYTYVAATEHLIRDRSLVMNDDAGPVFISVGADGKYYPKYPPGFSILAIPFYLLFGRTGCYLLSAVAGAGTVVVAYRLSRLLGARPTAALIACELYGLGSMNWPYARTTFVEELITFLAIAGTYFLFLSIARADAKLGLLAGASLGYIGLVKTITLVVCLPLLGYVIARRKMRAGVSFFISFTLVASLLLLYNTTIYGGPLRTGYQFNAHNLSDRVPPYNELEVPYGWSSPFYIGLIGLLFDVRRGLFAFSPALLLSIPGFFLAKGRKLEGAALFLCFLSVVMVHMSWWCWFGGTSFGARLIHPSDVYLIAPLSLTLCKYGHRPSLRVLVALLFSFSFYIASSGAVTDNFWISQP